MKRQTIGTAVLLSVLTASIGMGQCSRRGGGAGLSASNIGLQLPQISLASPFSSTFAGLPSQRAQIQQRAMFVQQQMYRQALAQRERRNATQLAWQRRRYGGEGLASASGRSVARQARLRQRNAEKAFAVAVKAEDNGRSPTAEKYYRRAIRIAGANTKLGERSQAAIAALSPSRLARKNNTLLSSIESDIASISY